MAKTLSDFLSSAATSKLTFIIGLMILLLEAVPSGVDVIYYFPTDFSDLLVWREEFVDWLPFLKTFVVWTGIGAVGIGARDANKNDAESGVDHVTIQ